jgi:hypothetical protein
MAASHSRFTDRLEKPLYLLAVHAWIVKGTRTAVALNGSAQYLARSADLLPATVSALKREAADLRHKVLYLAGSDEVIQCLVLNVVAPSEEVRQNVSQIVVGPDVAIAVHGDREGSGNDGPGADTRQLRPHEGSAPR